MLLTFTCHFTGNSLQISIAEALQFFGSAFEPNFMDVLNKALTRVLHNSFASHECLCGAFVHSRPVLTTCRP